MLNEPAAYGSVTSRKPGDLSRFLEDLITMRTSITDPLRIAEIEAGPGMGRVGLTFCPGKKQIEQEATSTFM